MNKIKIAIFASFAVLLVLITISILIGGINKVGEITQELPQIPDVKETKVLTDDQKLSEAKKIPVLESDSSDRLYEFQKTLPIINSDFELGFSDLTGQYYYYKKTPKADEEFENLIKNNNIGDLKKLIKVVNKNIEVVIQEDENRIIGTESSDEKSDDFELLKQTFNEILNSISSIEDISSTQSPEVENVNPILTGTTTLESIFNEAGQKVGTPPKILKGVLTRECPPILTLSDEKIAEYSQPGSGIPVGHGCFRNTIGASGPMQFLPDVWTSYAASVNRFGGYTHQPYIANIRDSVYGAAWKLKRDSQTTDLNWTYEQVKRAIICYNAGCGRLSNPPSSTLRYLEAVWLIYNS